MTKATGVWLATALLMCAPCALPGCGGDDTVTPLRDGGKLEDGSANVHPDGGVDAGDGGSVKPPDLAGDMARSWVDVSVTTSKSLWTVWNNGQGLTIAAGDGAAIYTSVNNGGFVADTSAKPGATPTLLSIGTIEPGPPGKPFYLAGASGSVWAYSGMLAAATGTFTAETTNTTASLNGVWVAPDGTAWAVGLEAALKRNAGVWSAINGIPASNGAYNLWGMMNGGGYLLYAVGAEGPTGSSVGRIWKSTGGDFTVESTSTLSTLYGFWGASPTDLYAVGDDGTILHSTGNGAWTAQTSGVTTPIDGIAGVNANEIYAVGEQGVLLHKFHAAATVWVKETVPGTVAGRGIYGVFASPTVVYAVGANGLILRK